MSVLTNQQCLPRPHSAGHPGDSAGERGPTADLTL